ELDKEKRRIRLGMKQLEPTSVDHYIAEHHAGETVSGRLVEVHGTKAKVELGEGVIAQCSITPAASQPEAKPATSSSDVSALSAMLSARWKEGGGEHVAGNGGPRAGQVCSFRIAHIDPSKRLIQLELAS